MNNCIYLGYQDVDVTALLPTRELAVSADSPDLVIRMGVDEAVKFRDEIDNAIKRINLFSNEKLADHAREIGAEMKARSKEAGIDDEAE